ncbi:MAG TPA: LysE/ArgO family amino acid transporter [Anaerolineales bacterium]|jgi:L-lysine exporter family protein LysE/ArgO
MSASAFLEGLSLGASLIIAIGAQNAFVLRQGLLRRHVLITALICILCDVALISLGVAGLGVLIESTPALLTIMTWGGAAFLFFYGLRSFQNALKHQSLQAEPASDDQVASVRGTVLAVLAFSLLNPHVYIDTVILLGGLGARHPAAERLSFVLGAWSASTLWFFGLAYGARFLTPLFQKPLTWRILDVLIGCVMWMIAIRLIWPKFQ